MIVTALRTGGNSNKQSACTRKYNPKEPTNRNASTKKQVLKPSEAKARRQDFSKPMKQKDHVLAAPYMDDTITSSTSSPFSPRCFLVFGFWCKDSTAIANKESKSQINKQREHLSTDDDVMHR